MACKKCGGAGYQPISEKLKLSEQLLLGASYKRFCTCLAGIKKQFPGAYIAKAESTGDGKEFSLKKSIPDKFCDKEGTLIFVPKEK